MLFTGEAIGAAEAKQIGMVNRVVADGTHLGEALAVARRIAALDEPLVRQTKKALNRSLELMGMGEALEVALAIDLEIEGEGMETKCIFLEIVRRDGLRAALDWRDKRLDERSL